MLYSIKYNVKYANEDYKSPFSNSNSSVVTISGENTAKTFIKTIVEEGLHIQKNHYDKVVPMSPLTEEQEENVNNEKICHICDFRLDETSPILQRNIDLHTLAIQHYERLENAEKVNFHTQKLQISLDSFEDNKRMVYDHDHLTGEFRGVAHSIGILNYRVPKFIPIFFHNLSGYDTHLFIKEIGEVFPERNIRIIANTEEKYISFSLLVRYDTGKVNLKGKPIYKTLQLHFIDSFRFLPASLDSLAKNLELD